MSEFPILFDEEAGGFGEPPKRPAPPLRPAQRAAAAVIALGALGFVLYIAGLQLGGGWSAIGATFGLITLGTVLWFWLDLRDTEPGIKHDGVFFSGVQSRGLLGWSLGIFITGFYIVLYFYDDLQKMGMPALLDRPIQLLDPLAMLTQGGGSSRWFLYGVLYTSAILVFGVRMFMKYRGNRYQQLRTASVMFFQFVFAWMLPNLLIFFSKPYMEFNGIWPLKQDYLWPEKVLGEYLGGAGVIGVLLFVWAIGMFVATPLLTYLFGKRWYCSWVCGCGGLAETLGDPWRQQSDKSTGAWKIERWMIHTVLLIVVFVTASLWIDHRMNGNLYGTWSGSLRKWYGFYIGAIFSGVIGVGFYPVLGSRIWCRFGCPQAAILGIWQRIFSRFRITTNGGQCISCGNCSTYCEMGIDVRAYAQKSENIVRASCVGCGVCAAVCPRGVLKLENGLPGDRFDGAESALGTFRDAFNDPRIYDYRSWQSSDQSSENTVK
ncbi:MAG: 4Fe-4S binding protein [Acidobacteriota bacterium]|nr:4Fe-4S binding protein [Acidobacteriota bacterium]